MISALDHHARMIVRDPIVIVLYIRWYYHDSCYDDRYYHVLLSSYGPGLRVTFLGGRAKAQCRIYRGTRGALPIKIFGTYFAIFELDITHFCFLIDNYHQYELLFMVYRKISKISQGKISDVMHGLKSFNQTLTWGGKLNFFLVDVAQNGCQPVYYV